MKPIEQNKNIIKQIEAQSISLASDEINTMITMIKDNMGEEALKNQDIQETIKPSEKSETKPAWQAKDIRFMHEESEAPDYKLLKKIGEGGMGLVFLGEQTSLKREIALKITKSGSEMGKRQAEGFFAEAIATGRLNHPNIIPIMDAGADREGHLFYVMKKVQSLTWKDLLQPKSEEDQKKAKNYTLEDHLNILHSVCNALAFSHSKNIIHRDLKPANVMLGEFGEVILLDWGLAISLDSKARFIMTKDKAGHGGTLAYMSPEMARQNMAKIGKQSDIYLLGAILFHILTGITPHTGKTFQEAVINAASNVIAVPQNPIAADKELLDIALKAMAFNPEERYRSVSDFQKALRDYKEFSERKKESQRITGQAEQYFSLAQTGEQKQYIKYLEAILLFKEAIFLWPENREAEKKLRKAVKHYIEQALKKNDHELALSILDEKDEKNFVLIQRIKKEKEKDIKQKQWYRTLRYSTLALSLIISVFLATGYFWIYKSYKGGDQALDHLFSGIHNITKQDYHEAISDYNQAIEISPDSAYAYIMRANLYFQKENYEKAMSDYDQAIKITPDSVYPYISQGKINYQKGRYQQAISDYTKVLEITPDSAETFEIRGHLFFNTGQYQSALADYNRTIKLKPDDAEIYIHRAAVYNILGEYKEALADCDKALTLKPLRSLAHLIRGIAYFETGNHEKAIDDFSQAIEIEPALSQAYAYRAASFTILEKHDKALSDCNRALKLSPGEAWLHITQGIALICKKDYVKAAAAYSLAIELQPGLTNAYVRRAMAYDLAGKHSQAISDLSAVINLSDRKELALLKRGTIFYYADENYVKAEKDFLTCMEENPQSPYGYLWMYLLKEKRGENGKPLLEDYARTFSDHEWIKPVVLMFLEKISVKECLSRARDKNIKKQNYKKSEACFYAGQFYLLRKEPDKAKALFQNCLRTTLPNAFIYSLAKTELARISNK